MLNFPFTSLEMTTAINRLPPKNKWLSNTGIYGVTKPVSTAVVLVGINEEGTVGLLTNSPRGSEGEIITKDAKHKVAISVAHFPSRDIITPGDIQGMQELAASGMVDTTFEDEFIKRLEKLRKYHDTMREYMRIAASRGVLRDKKGEMLSLFDVFGMEQTTIAFNLDNEATDVKAKCADVQDHIAEKMGDADYGKIEVPVGRTFFDKLRNHASVKEAYSLWANATGFTDPVDKPFEFGELSFRVVRGTVGGEPFVPATEGYPVIMGADGLYIDHNGPAHSVKAANQPGVDIYLTTKDLDHEGGVEIKAQSNPLPLCTNPAAIPKLTA
ncbi:major capsid protein [Terasakiella sp.]|uniref:major capsid protein n=1 Tax=Terasakiella sp. TaxID=2034861 RepID=UPI003AA83FFD